MAIKKLVYFWWPTFICHILELEEYLKMLDARADAAVQSSKHHFAQRKLRIDGAVAETTPPVSAPTWTISRDWRRRMFCIFLLLCMLLSIITYRTWTSHAWFIRIRRAQ